MTDGIREGSVTAARSTREEQLLTPRGPAAGELTAELDFANLTVGMVVAQREFHLTRDSLVRYAGASGDFNPIHYRDDIATSVGLPGVLAHGMLTMGIAAQPVIDRLGDPGLVSDYQVRFTRPVLVDAADGAHVHVVATVGAVDTSTDGHSSARIDLTVTFADETVLGKAQLRIRTGSA